MKTLVSVIIVAYKNMDCLKSCLESIDPDPRIEVIVVNNSHQNRGFGAGCNLGASLASGEVLLFLNPDTIASKDSVLALADALIADDSIGILGPALTDHEGKVVLSTSEQPTKQNFWIVYSLLNSVFKHSAMVQSHWYGHRPPKKSRDVGVVSGAAMGMRRDVFEEMGGFDEQFFLYWEEVDLARRCLEKGLRVVYQPSIKMVHHGGLSTVFRREQVMVWFSESRHYFMKKYYGHIYAGVVEGWLALSEYWQFSLVLLGLFGLNIFRRLYIGGRSYGDSHHDL
jgi:GT2 family glycosyltransferase